MVTIFDLLKYDKTFPLLFTSGTFWILFIAFLLVYSFIYNRKWQMLIFVTAFSFYFYYKCSGWFVLMLIGTSLVDWVISILMSQTQSKRLKKLLVVTSLLLSLGLLAYFKYANFFASTFADIINANFQPMDIFLPIGISFYTFQSVSYIVDVYKGKVKPTSTWLEYAFFLSFFPPLVAGPIVRADKFLPQISTKKNITNATIYAGLWLVIVGIFKKAIIADYISQYNDLIFDTPGAYSGFESAMGIVGYAAQIYCDFSGYSDMAIGIAVIMGFDIGINFRTPYMSSNITEFWRRWHISLSSWLRDYIYIPLGGNRKGKVRTYVNSFLTMLIGGLWHGASWNFIFWGAMHGVGLFVHKVSEPVLKKIPDNIFTINMSRLITFLFVITLWVFFRSADYNSAFTLIKHTVTDFDIAYILPFISVRGLWCFMIILIFALHTTSEARQKEISDVFVKSNWFVKAAIFLIVIQLVIQFKSEAVQPFIYFQF